MTESDEAERRLGRAVALGLPIAGAVATVVTGVTAGFGSALLVLASTALLSTIALLWASLRTLSGDAPLPSALTGPAPGASRVDALSERKRRVLRALKDMENERALGKIDEADYADVAARYRDEAKAIMREMEEEVAPAMEEAERVARDYLKRRRGSLKPEKAPKVAEGEKKDAKGGVRVACDACAASNEPDAAFCKGCGARLKDAANRQAHAKA